MIARGLVGQFVEAADEVLEEQPHVVVADVVGVQVQVAELGDDEVEEVGLAHPLYLVGELEILEDAADVGGEAVDVTGEVLVNVVGVALELLEGERRVIVEPLAGRFAEELVEGFVVQPAALPLLVFAEHLFLGRREDTVEAAEDGHGQHDALILRRAVRPPQQVGNLPDEVRQFVVVGHRLESLAHDGHAFEAGKAGSRRYHAAWAPDSPGTCSRSYLLDGSSADSRFAGFRVCHRRWRPGKVQTEIGGWLKG